MIKRLKKREILCCKGDWKFEMKTNITHSFKSKLKKFKTMGTITAIIISLSTIFYAAPVGTYSSESDANLTQNVTGNDLDCNVTGNLDMN